MNLAKRAATTQIQGAGLSLSDLDRVMDAIWGGNPSFAGPPVSQQTALAVSTVWGCISNYADDIATLPLKTFRKLSTGGREEAQDHYLWNLLMLQANPELSAWRFFQLMQTWVLQDGNAYAELDINGRGQITAIWPWRPDRTVITREYKGGPLQYQYRMQNGSLTPPVPAYRMFHLRGLGTDGIRGLSPIEVHKQTIGLSLAITEHGARFFGQGARPLGIIKSKLALGPKARENLKSTWRDMHEGLSNAMRVAILEEDLDWQATGENMVDCAYIESQNLSAEDIARIYKMPKHRLGLGDPNNSSAEEFNIEYVIYSLAPWAANWQNQVHCDMLSSRENDTYYTSFDFANLLRGSHKDMVAYISGLVDRGILNADEVRNRFLDMNDQPDGIGKEFYKAVNMSPVGDEGKDALTAPNNMSQVKKVGKKPPANEQDEQQQQPQKAKDKASNGHAALHGMGLSDNLIGALVDFIHAQSQPPSHLK